MVSIELFSFFSLLKLGIPRQSVELKDTICAQIVLIIGHLNVVRDF